MLAALVLALNVVGDGIPQPLTATPGDALRGRALVVDRQRGHCLLCHGGAFPEEPSPGTVAAPLTGAGSRWSDAQLRLRVADARRLNPATVMPTFHGVPTAARVPARWQQPLLSAQEVEDVVAFLRTLQ